ncbi:MULTISPECIES: MarR family winged helix-turn-helix transcriptional regulator [unclassified Pseudonocardia]|uniref:MarR family winged helix-turn-helix transcriptional regulator n=1 Tax=unclassified Pseudonocardia TaxID=2619320 RepID=UPI000A878BC6|nr:MULTISPECIES: MarR family winged helix-turn-helix transcriptional regulator [unclassified Pseudonocardia]
MPDRPTHPSPSPLLCPPRLVPAGHGPAGGGPADGLHSTSTADLLVRTGAAVLGARRSRAAAHGLPLTAVTVLDVLSRTGGGLVQRELAAWARIGPTTLVPVLDALADAGLAERVVDPVDRRVRRVRITDAGRERLRAARPAVRGPRLPEPPAEHAEAIRGYLVAVVVALEQDHRETSS